MPEFKKWLLCIAYGTATQEVNRSIRKALIDPDRSFDVLVVTEAEYQEQRSKGWRIYDEIAKDGKVIDSIMLQKIRANFFTIKETLVP